jgi:hypothetical protein
MNIAAGSVKRFFKSDNDVIDCSLNERRACYFLKAAMIYIVPVVRYLGLKITLQQAAANLPRKEF